MDSQPLTVLLLDCDVCWRTVALETTTRKSPNCIRSNGRRLIHLHGKRDLTEVSRLSETTSRFLAGLFGGIFVGLIIGRIE